MKKLYKKFKGFKVLCGEYGGVVCGYCENHFLVATLDRPACSFRRTKPDTFIEEEYVDSQYRYFYADESMLEKQTKSGRKR